MNQSLSAFESSLFNIKQLARADLFDSELDAADELLKHKFSRPARVVSGVVLEKNLAQVCAGQKIIVKKTDPTINDLNDLLKDAGGVAFDPLRIPPLPSCI